LPSRISTVFHALRVSQQRPKLNEIAQILCINLSDAIYFSFFFVFICHFFGFFSISAVGALCSRIVIGEF